MSASTLFALLDTCIKSDDGPPGFQAKIGFGVLGERGVQWWVGDFGRQITTSRPDQTPEGCDTVLLLGEEEAQKLIAGQPLGAYPRSFSVLGDRRNLLRFNQRYINRRSVVGIRLGTSS